MNGFKSFVQNPDIAAGGDVPNIQGQLAYDQISQITITNDFLLVYSRIYSEIQIPPVLNQDEDTSSSEVRICAMHIV